MLKYVACILLSLAVWNNPVKAETNEIYSLDGSYFRLPLLC